MPNSDKYRSQRPKKTPPQVSLQTLRRYVLKLTIDEVIERVRQELNAPDLKLSRGHISALETGTRGVSQDLLDALCLVYGIPQGSIVTDGTPRTRDLRTGDAA